MVTYGGMSKKPITVSTSSFIFKVRSITVFYATKLFVIPTIVLSYSCLSCNLDQHVDYVIQNLFFSFRISLCEGFGCRSG